MDFNKRWILLVIAALMSVQSRQVGAFVLSADEEGDDDEGYQRPPEVPIEQLIESAAETPEELNFFFDNDNQLLKVEYDIVLSLEEWAAIQRPHRQKRTVGLYPWKAPRWTDKVVNYEIVNDHMSNDDMNVIAHAIAEWDHYTCLTFKETNEATNRLVLQQGGGCYSRLGMVGGMQTVGLGRGCRSKRIVLHELGHALGVHHEQTRPDRDEHITVHMENIGAEYQYNFWKSNWNSVMNFSIPYDYESIMHYSEWSFSYTGRPSIITKDPKYQNKIGKFQDLSFGDVKTVNKMYECGKATPECTLTDEDCPGQGFVGKDCLCWCPGRPVQYCFEKDKKSKGDLTDVEFCGANLHSSCQVWADHGFCTKPEHLNYMRDNCAKACNHCSDKDRA